VSSIATVLVDSLDDDALDALALRLVPRLVARLGSTSDVWMSTADAAAYLGVTRNSLHKLTAARVIPFEQDGPGCKLWFRRGDLDIWRRSGGSRRYRRWGGVD
jgi:excisionase family DNA binding protein